MACRKRFGWLMAALAVIVAGETPAHAARILWASDSDGGSSSTLFKLDADTGAVLGSLPGPGTYADALSFANDGQSIFVLDSSTNSDVYQIDLAGNILNNFDVALDAEGLTVLRDGSLVIGGGGSNTIAFVNSTTGAILSQFTPVAAIYGMASNGVDRLYGLRIDGSIDTYDLAGNHLGNLSTGVSGVTLGLAYTGSSFFIASTGSTITEISLTGTFIRSYAGPGPFTEGLDFPAVQTSAVPEPSTLALAGIGGVIGLLGYARRRRQAITA